MGYQGSEVVSLQSYIMELVECFDFIEFHHILKEDNQLADALATLSSMFVINQDGVLSMIQMKSHKEPTYCHFIEEELYGKPWYFDIKHYLKTREYPREASENDKRTLRRLAANFILSRDGCTREIMIWFSFDAWMRKRRSQYWRKFMEVLSEHTWMDTRWLERSWEPVTFGWLWRMSVAHTWESARNVKSMQIISIWRPLL